MANLFEADGTAFRAVEGGAPLLRPSFDVVPRSGFPPSNWIPEPALGSITW